MLQKIISDEGSDNEFSPLTQLKIYQLLFRQLGKSELDAKITLDLNLHQQKPLTVTFTK